MIAGLQFWYNMHRTMMSVLMVALTMIACSMSDSSENNSATQDPEAPLVLLLAPVNRSTFAAGTAVQLYATAQDVEGRIARLEFLVDELAVGNVAADNPQGQAILTGTVTWIATGAQKHLVTVQAVQPDGALLGEMPISVTVVEPSVAGGVSGSPVVNPAITPAMPSTTTDDMPTSAPAPQTDLGILTGPPARVIAPTLNLRQGPGTNYPPVGELKQNDQLQIVGRNADRTWWAVLYRGGTAWVFAELVDPEGDTSTVPLVATPGS